MDAKELIAEQLLKDGGIFVYGIHLHSSALIRHNPKSEIEEVLVFQEFHRPGIPGLIRWTSTFPVDSKMIEIQREEVIRYPTAPIGPATILKLSNGWDWDGDICTNQAEPVFNSRIGDGCQELFKISSDAVKSDNL